MRVLLTRKLAEVIDGIDLKGHNVGDVIDLPRADGDLLIAERWAITERRGPNRAREWPRRRPPGSSDEP